MKNPSEIITSWNPNLFAIITELFCWKWMRNLLHWLTEESQKRSNPKLAFSKRPELENVLSRPQKKWSPFTVNWAAPGSEIWHLWPDSTIQDHICKPNSSSRVDRFTWFNVQQNIEQAKIITADIQMQFLHTPLTPCLNHKHVQCIMTMPTMDRF